MESKSDPRPTCVALPRHGLHSASLRGLMRSHPATLVEQAGGDGVTAQHHILSIRGGRQRTVTVLSQQHTAGQHATWGMIGEHGKIRTLVEIAGMMAMALMRKTADAAVWHQGPQEDITLTPVHQSLIVEMVVVTMIHGNGQGDGDGIHRSLHQSRPHAVIVHIGDDSGAGTDMGEKGRTLIPRALNEPGVLET